MQLEHSLDVDEAVSLSRPMCVATRFSTRVLVNVPVIVVVCRGVGGDSSQFFKLGHHSPLRQGD